MRLPLFQAIEIKATQEYFNTPDPLFNNGVRSYKHNSPIPLMYFVLYHMAYKAQAATVASGQHYCHECSGERGRPVYHYNQNYLSEFRDKFRKALPILQRIQDEHLY